MQNFVFLVRIRGSDKNEKENVRKKRPIKELWKTRPCLHPLKNAVPHILSLPGRIVEKKLVI